jgi:hypothetical protein
VPNARAALARENDTPLLSEGCSHSVRDRRAIRWIQEAPAKDRLGEHRTRPLQRGPIDRTLMHIVGADGY